MARESAVDRAAAAMIIVCWLLVAGCWPCCWSRSRFSVSSKETGRNKRSYHPL
jgi:hypothetical protein